MEDCGRPEGHPRIQTCLLRGQHRLELEVGEVGLRVEELFLSKGVGHPHPQMFLLASKGRWILPGSC